MEPNRQKPGFFSRSGVRIVLTIIIGIGLIISILDIRKILSLVEKINFVPLFLSFATAALSYLFLGLALNKLLELVGERLSFKEMFAISWVSTSLNNLFSTGGVAGLTMRVFLLRRKNISFSDTFLVSFVHTLLINGVLIGFVMFGFGYLLTTANLRLYQYLISSGVLIFTLTLAFLATGSVIDRPFRERFIDFFYSLTNWLSFKFTKRLLFKKAQLDEFKAEFHQGISLMLSHKGRILLPAFYVFLDWLACLLTLYFAFLAIGYPISPGILVVGFAIGIFVPLISFIPGAIGIMEGSMAAIYYSLNVPPEVAIVAVLLYRGVLHVFPFVTSTLLYRPLFREAKAIRTGQLPEAP